MDLQILTHLLFSLFLFSFIISYSTSYTFSLISLKLYLSALSSQILSHLMDKNCIFLIFNGILVFIAKTSGLTSAFSSLASEPNNPLSDPELGKIRMEEDNQDSGLIIVDKEIDVGARVSRKSYEVDEKYVTENKKGPRDRAIQGSRLLHVRDVCSLAPVCRDNISSTRNLGIIEGIMNNVDDDNDIDDDGGGMLSSEELNKKFDDFIRRMKVEFRVGAN